MSQSHRNLGLHYRRGWGAVAVVFAAGLILSACSKKAAPESFYRDDENLVRLDTRPAFADGLPDVAFEHPATISPEELTRVLIAIRVEGKRGVFEIFRKEPPPSLRAFSDDEAGRMAKPLAEALAKAEPNQRVSFLFTQKRWRLSDGITSGVLFVKGERLHFIFGRYRSTSRPHEPDVTLNSRALANPPYTGFRFAAGSHLAIVDSDESPVWKERIGSKQWVMADYKNLLAEPPAETEPFPVLAEPESKDAPTTEARRQGEEVKEKLRLLEEMRQENLITEEEYQKKRKEAIKGL